MDPILNAGAAVAPAAQVAESALDQLDSEAFLKLFVAQLRYQNPMEPSGGTEMMLQTAQFSQVEMMQRIFEAQQELMGMTALTQAANLVGRSVTAAIPGVGTVSGEVTGYRVTEDGPVLLVGDNEVPLGAAAEVTA